MRRSVAGLAKPRDGRWRRPGSNQDANSRAREGVAPQACRLLACGKAGKGTAKPPARTCTILSIKREHQLAAPWRELLSGSTRTRWPARP